MNRRAFTIMELLVVVAIIAILAAMIMPVLLQAKEAARTSKCVENLRQVGISVSAYMDDNDGYGLPAAPWESELYSNPWILFVEPLIPRYIPQQYIKPRVGTGAHQPAKLWICPGDIVRSKSSSASGEADNDRPCWWWWGASYLYPGPTAYQTAQGQDPFQRGEHVKPLKPAMWRIHRRDILLADYWFDFHNIGRRVPKDVTRPEIIPNPSIWENRADVKTTNVLFLDMHVTSMTGPQRERYIKYTVESDNPYRVK